MSCLSCSQLNRCCLLNGPLVSNIFKTRSDVSSSDGELIQLILSENGHLQNLTVIGSSEIVVTLP